MLMHKKRYVVTMRQMGLMDFFSSPWNAAGVTQFSSKK